MTEQWFLDLDGTRSGPYQTPEVLSLIAEGEVLPHHRISTSLREQKWITILDWRLDQAKLSRKAPVTTPTHLSRSEISSVEGIDETRSTVSPVSTASQSPAPIFASQPADQASEANPTSSANIIALAYSVKLAHSPAQTSSTAPTASIRDALNDYQKIILESAPDEIHTQEEDSTAHWAQERLIEERTEPAINVNPKRDPMAEMFDMLQKTKSKREAKQAQSEAAGISIAPEAEKTAQNSGLTKTLMIGVGITLIGFALGQLFQQAAPTLDPNAGKTSPSPVAVGSKPSATEVVDRSTDKMTIRGVVKKPEATPSPAKVGARPARAGNSDTPQTEKELEELQNLKKELQELKNLKNDAVDTDFEAPEGDGFDGKDPGLDPGYNSGLQQPSGGFPSGRFPPGGNTGASDGYPQPNPNGTDAPPVR